MHLRQDVVEALLGIGFSIEDELTPHIIQLEELDADSVTICLENGLLISRCLLMVIDFFEEVLQ